MTARRGSGSGRGGARRAPSRAGRAAGVALAALLANLTGCGPQTAAADPPRLFVLFATCSLNKSFLAPYDETVDYTPEIAALAAESVVFERHVTEAGQSGIAYASLYTGLHSDRHGVYRHPTKLPDELYMLSEAFRDGGFENWFWDGHPMARRGLDYAQGIGWDQVVTVDTRPQRIGVSPILPTVLRRVSDDPGYRAYVVSNNAIPHGPYDLELVERFGEKYAHQVPELDWQRARELYAIYRRDFRQLQFNFEESAARHGFTPEDVVTLSLALETAYKAQIHELDEEVGRVVAAIREAGLWDETVFVLTSDHGEVLFRDNALFKWTHGMQLAPEVLDVALIVRTPQAGSRGGRYPGVSRSIDVYPTLAGLASLAVPAAAAVEGRDLSAALLGRQEPPRLIAYSHTSLPPRNVLREMQEWTLALRYYPRVDPELIWVRLRDGDRVYKYRNLDGTVWATQAFDLAGDPEERVDLFDPTRQEDLEAQRKLLAYRDRLIHEYRHYEHSKRRELLRPSNEEELEALRALGYIGG